MSVGKTAMHNNPPGHAGQWPLHRDRCGRRPTYDARDTSVAVRVARRE